MEDIISKSVIESDKAPAAFGPYSQAVRTGQFIFCSGQLGVDPQTGEMVPGGVSEQATQVLNNLTTVLEAGGMSLEQVVKATVFLQSMDDFAQMNAVYEKYFTGAHPARSTVQVSRLPKDALVEIEAIACDA